MRPPKAVYGLALIGRPGVASLDASAVGARPLAGWTGASSTVTDLLV
jgi:hypothetical protein